MLDITDAAQVAMALETVTKGLRPDYGLAGLVNNAGIVVAGPLELLPIDSLRRQFEVNVIGYLAATQAFLPLIRKGRGRIINISTAGSRLPVPFLGAYSASKIAMESLTDALRRELLPWGIHVSTIEPGMVETPIWGKTLAAVKELRAELPVKPERLYAERFSAGLKFMEVLRRHAVPPEVVAQVVCRILEVRRPKPRYRVGIGAHLPSAIARFAPDRLIDWMVGKVLGT